MSAVAGRPWVAVPSGFQQALAAGEAEVGALVVAASADAERIKRARKAGIAPSAAGALDVHDQAGFDALNAEGRYFDAAERTHAAAVSQAESAQTALQGALAQEQRLLALRDQAKKWRLVLVLACIVLALWLIW